MKIKAKYLLVTLFFFVPMLTVHIGCKKDKDPASPVVFVSPEDLHTYANASDVVSFSITATSETGLASLKIESKVDNGTSFTQTELEETLSSVGTYNKLFEMTAPQSAAGSSVILTFTVTDSDGLQTIALRRLWVEAAATLLTETSGHTMYNHNSSGADAYNLELGEAVISKFSTDSLERDIEDFPVDSITQILSRSWISPAGGNFVKFNSFDYANATDSSVVQAYSSGVALPQVSDLAVSDVILYHYTDSLASWYAVIQISTINNVDTTTSTDSYVFNIKK